MLYLYHLYQIWPLEKETSCCEGEDFSNLVKLVVVTSFFYICRLVDSNLKLEDLDPMLHLKVIPFEDSDPLCEGFRSLCLILNQWLTCNKKIQILFLGIHILCLVLHFPKWGIWIFLWGIQIIFSSSFSVSILHRGSWILLSRIRILGLVSKVFTSSIRDSDLLSWRFKYFIGPDLLF